MGEPVPNEVFLRTRAGLSTMVSSRAAGRILEGALKGSGHDPEMVNQSQMRSALLGPVLHELENVLPRAGLRRNLERLAKSLREPNGEREMPTALLTGSIPAQSAAPSAPPEPVTQPTPQSPFEAFAGPPTLATGGEVVVKGAAKKVTPRFLRRLADEELETKVTRFALIDNVRLVAVIRADGSVPVYRGDGLDLDLLSRLCRLSLSLLAKGGELRSLHLGHSQGQLFLFPIGPDLLIVLGSTDLNLGSVTTAFTALALEEEL